MSETKTELEKDIEWIESEIKAKEAQMAAGVIETKASLTKELEVWTRMNKILRREINILLGQVEVAREAAKVLRPGVQADSKSFSVGFEDYPYSDTFDPENDDHGENEDVGTLISFLNIFGGPEDKAISHYAKDPEEQETLARQSAHYGW